MYPLPRCSNESRAIFLAFHVAAARDFRRAMADPLSPEEVVEVTSSSLRGYMARRAAVCPLARTVLLWTRFQAAVQAIQECAGDRNFDLYHALLPIVGHLVTCTHGTQYALIVWEELVRYQTLSEAEQVSIFPRKAPLLKQLNLTQNHSIWPQNNLI